MSALEEKFPEEFSLSVKGCKEETISVSASSTTTIRELKEAVRTAMKCGAHSFVASFSMRLFFAGKEICGNDKTISFYGLQPSSLLFALPVTDERDVPHYILEKGESKDDTKPHEKRGDILPPGFYKIENVGTALPLCAGFKPILAKTEKYRTEVHKFTPRPVLLSTPTDRKSRKAAAWKITHPPGDMGSRGWVQMGNEGHKEMNGMLSCKGGHLVIKKREDCDKEKFRLVQVRETEFYIVSHTGRLISAKRGDSEEKDSTVCLTSTKSKPNRFQTWRILNFKDRRAHAGRARERMAEEKEADKVDMSEIANLMIDISPDGRDMLTLQRQISAESPRYIMPCSHIMSAASLVRFCESIMDNPSQSEFICPEPDCESTWPYPLVRKVANLSDKQKLEFEEKLSIKLLNDVDWSPCPQCGTTLNRRRTDSLLATCVVCEADGNDLFFCWKCRKKWKDSAIVELCGHDGCGFSDRALRDDVIEILAKCGKKTIGVVADVPEFRACPKCGQLIHHREACKHISCSRKYCNTAFCFVCLSLYARGGWPCGSHSDACKIAPPQTDKDLPRR